MELVALIALGALVGGWYFASETARWRALRHQPLSQVGHLTDGARVKLVGRIVAGGPIEAPLTGRPCVGYEASIADPPHPPVHAARSLVPFVLEDDGGRVLVEADDDAVLLLVAPAGLRQGPLAEASRPRVEQIIAPRGPAARGWMTAMRFTEHVLSVGDRVVVGGYAVREPDPDAVHAARGYRDEPPMRWCIRGSGRNPLRICDQPAGFTAS